MTAQPNDICGHANCGKPYSEHQNMAGKQFCFSINSCGNDEASLRQVFTPSSDKPELTRTARGPIIVDQEVEGGETPKRFGPHGFGFHLKNCPFCGGEPTWVNEAVADSHYHIRCVPCNFILKADRRDKVVALWNNRKVGEQETPPQHNKTSNKMSHPHRLPDVYYIVRQITTGCYLAGEKYWMRAIQYAMPFATRNDAIDYMKDTKRYSAVEIVEIYNVTEQMKVGEQETAAPTDTE